MGNLSADSVKLTASQNHQTVSHHRFDDATVFGAIRGFAPGALSTVLAWFENTQSVTSIP